MLSTEYAIFLGKEKENFFTGFAAEEGLFLVLEIKNTLPKEEARGVIESIKNDIISEKPKILSRFSSIVKEKLKKYSENGSISLAAALVVGDVLYLKTYGGGEIYLKRGDDFRKVIDGEHDASGYLNDEDFFIFTTSDFTSRTDTDYLKNRLKGAPKDVVERITPRLKEREDAGSIALFVQFHKKKDEVREEQSRKEPEEQSLISHLKRHFRYYKAQSSRGKKLTLIAVIALFVVLAWSVVFGVQRRARAELESNVKSYEGRINKKLDEAVDISALNVERSLTLLSEAKKDLKNLKELVGDAEFNEVSELEKKIKGKEKKITKQEDRKHDEFYDLALIGESASGSLMFKALDNVAILDRDGGRIYILSLTKKSTETVKKSVIKGAKLISLYNDELFVLDPKKGIYRIDADREVKLIIEKDDEWGDVVDFWVYSGNLYLLDAASDEIYKYLVAEGGYSDTTSYFKEGQSIDLSSSSSMAIDAFIYIAVDGRAYKYVSGAQDAFPLIIPDGADVSFSRIFTDVDTKKLYLLDKENGTMYISSKDGAFEKQINSSIFKKADDFIVFEEDDAILVLVDDKIYKVGLN